jgi:hypothetical protein
VAELAVDGNAEYLGACVSEIRDAVRKRSDFRRSDKREIERVEVKDNPFALVS